MQTPEIAESATGRQSLCHGIKITKNCLLTIRAIHADNSLGQIASY